MFASQSASNSKWVSTFSSNRILHVVILDLNNTSARASETMAASVESISNGDTNESSHVTARLPDTIPPTQPSEREDFIETRPNTSDAATAQSPVPRASPAPIPNGKPSSPYVKESSPMVGGAPPAQTISSKDPKAAAAAANDMRNVVRRKLTGYVGFANLPNQWHRKSVRKGFSFNVMVVGKYPRSQ